MCPCNGICRTLAQVNMDLFEYFENPEHRREFARWLEAQGITTCRWWRMKKVDGWALGISTAWAGLAFTGNEIQISDEGEYDAHKLAIDTAYGKAQLYIGQLIQAEVFAALKDMGLSPRDVKVKNDYTIEVRINVGPGSGNIYNETARVAIALSGEMTLVTEDGGFEAGKNKLATILGLLGNRLDVTPSNEFETHRHAQQQEFATQYL